MFHWCRDNILLCRYRYNNNIITFGMQVNALFSCSWYDVVRCGRSLRVTEIFCSTALSSWKRNYEIYRFCATRMGTRIKIKYVVFCCKNMKTAQTLSDEIGPCINHRLPVCCKKTWSFHLWNWTFVFTFQSQMLLIGESWFTVSRRRLPGP